MFLKLGLLLLNLICAYSCTHNEYSDYKLEYNKHYLSEMSDKAHYNTYCDNVKHIEEVNSRELSYKLGINQFTDLTREELSGYNGYLKSNRTNNHHNRTSILGVLGDVPLSYDWRDYHKVTSVKDQGQCGSCWAFSAIGSLESVYAIHGNNHTLYNFSEQELVDCDSVDSGCGGGLMDNAFNFIMDNGICSYKQYPYNASDNTCMEKNCTSLINVSRYLDVLHNSETQLLYALLSNPVSVAIDASGDFMSYESGVYNGTCGTNLDHGVVLVGYGFDKVLGLKYWIVKNSWATTWGDNGYIYMLRDVDAEEGMCGIAMAASYPVL